MIHTVYKGEIVFVRLLFSQVLGIACALLWPFNLDYHFGLGVSLALFLPVLAFWVTYKHFKIYLRKWLPGIFVQVLIAFLSFTLTLCQKPDSNAFSRVSSEGLVATVISEPKKSKGILRFETEVQQVLRGNQFFRKNGRLLIALKEDSLNVVELKYGDRVLLPFKVNEIDPPYNPNEFDYKKYLANHGVYYQAFISSSELKLLEREKGNAIVAYAQLLRQKMVNGFSQFIPGNDAAALASTLILGYRADLSPEVIQAYSKTGTMHVLSVSGMHVALVLIILTKLLGFMDRNKRLKIVKAVIVVSLIWLYSLITGFSPSVCRAALMISLLIIGKTVNRRTNTYNIIAASAVLLLIYNPYFLVDAGFQLSYLAVLGLVYLYPKIYHLWYIKNWLGDQTWSYTALSVAAQAATAPLSMFYFHQFPLYFLLSNLFIVIPISIIMYGGLAFLFLYALSGSSPVLYLILKIFGFFLGCAIDGVNKALIYIENLPYASLSFYHYNLFYYLVMFFGMLTFVISLQYRRKTILFASFFLFTCLISFTSFSKIERQNQKSITFYSLRKNTAIGFQNGDVAYLYSDLDPEDKTFSFSVKPSLDALSDEIRYLKPSEKFIQSNFFYNHNCFQFSNYKILVWDKLMNNSVFKKPLNVDLVLISGNPKVNLSDIQKSARFKTLLFDGTNKDYRVQAWVQEAQKLKLNYYVLKKHPAYRINLESY